MRILNWFLWCPGLNTWIIWNTKIASKSFPAFEMTKLRKCSTRQKSWESQTSEKKFKFYNDEMNRMKLKWSKTNLEQIFLKQSMPEQPMLGQPMLGKPMLEQPMVGQFKVDGWVFDYHAHFWKIIFRNTYSKSSTFVKVSKWYVIRPVGPSSVGINPKISDGSFVLMSDGWHVSTSTIFLKTIAVLFFKVFSRHFLIVIFVDMDLFW